MRQVIEVELGGSGSGPSFHQSNVRCPRRSQLDHEAPSETSLTEGADERGTAFHAFLADYYTHQDRTLNTSKVRFECQGELWVPTKEARLEAERLFRVYRTKFGPDEFGPNDKNMKIETTFKVPAEEELDWKPKGVLVTGQIDLLVYLTEAVCSALGPTRGVALEEGWGVIDHKSSGAMHLILASKYRLDIQNRVYQLLFEYNMGFLPQGGLINQVAATKDVKFATFVVPPVTDLDRKIIYNFLLRSKEELDIKDSTGTARVNPTSCLDFNRVCHHYTEGRCQRV